MGGHVGRLVSRLMNRTERSEEAQATQRRPSPCVHLGCSHVHSGCNHVIPRC